MTEPDYWQMVTALPILALCVLLVCAFSGADAQDQPSREAKMAGLMDKVRQGKDVGEFSEFVREEGFDALPLLDGYRGDSSEKVRRRVRKGYSGILRNTTDAEKRRALVERLVTGLDDVDRGWVTRRLCTFSRDDFSETTKAELHRELEAITDGTSTMSPASTPDLILAVGVADMGSELPALKEIVERAEAKGKLKQGEDQYLGVGWAALRARARMGVKEDIQRCIDLVESHPDAVARAHGFFGLGYVLQPEVVRYISTYLDRPEVIEVGDEKHRMVIPWGHYAYGILKVKMLKDVPEPTVPFSSETPRELQTQVMRNEALELKKWLDKQEAYEFDR